MHCRQYGLWCNLCLEIYLQNLNGGKQTKFHPLKGTCVIVWCLLLPPPQLHFTFCALLPNSNGMTKKKLLPWSQHMIQMKQREPFIQKWKKINLSVWSVITEIWVKLTSRTIYHPRAWYTDKECVKSILKLSLSYLGIVLQLRWYLGPLC